MFPNIPNAHFCRDSAREAFLSVDTLTPLSPLKSLVYCIKRFVSVTEKVKVESDRAPSPPPAEKPKPKPTAKVKHVSLHYPG